MGDAAAIPCRPASERDLGVAVVADAAPSVWTSWLMLLESAASPSAGDRASHAVESYRGQLWDFLVRRSEPRQLLVDVTDIARLDHGGGIQRVTHRLLGELLFAPPEGYRVEPVRLTDEGRYVYARSFLGSQLGVPPDHLGEDAPIAFSEGDHFLGLDLIRDCAGTARPALLEMRRVGVFISFVVYDILPHTHPQWFLPGIDTTYNEWLHLVAETADLALCISADVSSELANALEEMGCERKRPLLTSFPLGADFAGWTAGPRVLHPLPDGVARFLIVGTIERRKGHRVALDAFEELWRDGVEVQLVIAGKPAWMVGPVLERLREWRGGGNLHWFDVVDDRTLASLYRESTALLAPSEGEGFGLPLVEAARNRLPIVARDLPVFREVAGSGAVYFTGAGNSLAKTLRMWLDLWSAGEVSSAQTPPHLWADSAEALKSAMEKYGARA